MGEKLEMSWFQQRKRKNGLSVNFQGSLLQSTISMQSWGYKKRFR